VGVITVYVTKLIEYRSGIMKDLRDKKTPIYTELILFFLSAMNSDKMTEEERDEFFRKGMLDLQPRLMLWGSDKVLRLWFKLRSGSNSDGVYVLSLFDEIVREIRKDLGYRNSGVKDGDVLKLFINDLDDEQMKAIVNHKSAIRS